MEKAILSKLLFLDSPFLINQGDLKKDLETLKRIRSKDYILNFSFFNEKFKDSNIILRPSYDFILTNISIISDFDLDFNLFLKNSFGQISQKPIFFKHFKNANAIYKEKPQNTRVYINALDSFNLQIKTPILSSGNCSILIEGVEVKK